jgi:hypothetical protein
MAMFCGADPTGTGVPGVFVVVLIGVTSSEPLLATYAVPPFGVIAIAAGSVPTVIGVPGVFVAVLIGVTVLDPTFVT